MARFAYSLLLTLLLPILLGRLWWRGRKNPGYRARVSERLGFVKRMEQPGTVWVHAVSVGETLAAKPLIEALIERYPDRVVWVTSTTPTGAEQVQRLFGDRVEHSFMPYDLSWIWWLFGRRVKPACLVVMETELWPNLIRWCARHKVPSLLANARLSARSAKGYRKFSAITRPMLQRLSCVACQNPVDGDRFLQLGLPTEQLKITGSIKFDVNVDQASLELAQQWRNHWGADRKVLILASSHEGEDSLLLDCLARMQSRIPGLLLLLVPRHPERFDSVYQQAMDDGFVVERRSQFNLDTPVNELVQVVIGDSMGEMMAYLAASDVVLMGGSLVERGGHNPIEPAALGKPVLMGPHYFNFQQIVEQLADARALTLTSVDELELDLANLLANDSACENMGKAGLKQVERSRGAVARQADLLAMLVQANER